MQSFKEFVEQQEFVDFILNEVESPAASSLMQPAATVNPLKPWSAKKPEILQMWRNFRNDTPIIMTPILDNPNDTEHSTYGEDGIRITGSWNFIASVMGRIKELINYENPQHKLRLVLRGVDGTKSHRSDRKSYVFYCNLEGRSLGKAGRPKQIASTTPQFSK
jgi:hypothetical protein